MPFQVNTEVLLLRTFEGVPPGYRGKIVDVSDDNTYNVEWTHTDEGELVSYPQTSLWVPATDLEKYNRNE